ncbi:MAG TPA: peptidase domain-containing ABC transporter [Gemmatimonadaceae bacterium]
MLRRVPKVRQQDATDCGVACLASIARYHRRPISIMRLRELAQTDRQGTTLLGLSRAAAQLGFSAKAVRGTGDQLPHAPMPAIAHVLNARGERHYVVLERANGKRVWLMDPESGERRSPPRRDFEGRWTGALLLLAPSAAPSARLVQVGRGARVWRLMRPHVAALALAIVGALVYTVLTLSMSVYVQQVVDTVLAKGQANVLRVMTLVMLAIAVAQGVIGSLRASLMVHVGQRVDAELILGYYRHLIRLPQRFFDGMRVGELTSRITDAVKIRTFVSDVIVEAFANVLVVGASTVLMFLYDWRLAAWTLSILPAYLGIFLIGGRISRGRQRALVARAAALEAHVVESLGAIGTIKRFGVEERTAQETEARVARLFREAVSVTRTSIRVNTLAGAIGRVGTIGLLWIGASRALQHGLTAGQLMSCYALMAFLTGPALSLVSFGRSVEEARVAAERLFDVMEMESEVRPSPLRLPASHPGDVRFDHVTFRYGSRATTLANVSLRCTEGRVTAIVGPSGSGKSTVAALVQRLYEVDEGRVLIGAHDIRHLDLANLRRRVCVVPQTADLFAGSVLENIVLDDPQPDMDRVLKVCDDVGLRERIERLPAGFLTEVGERGVSLSGGERQRLAVARALYRRPAVLILDEATSALDAANEQLVLAAAQRAAQTGTTVIVIAHRLALIRGADHIIALSEGRVVEEGRHVDLLARSGTYAALWADQHTSATLAAAG